MIFRLLLASCCILVIILFVSCSKSVRVTDVYGTYVVSYPFGTETLSLDHDRTFTQAVNLSKQPPITVRGSWQFDPDHSRLDLSGSLIVVDGFGNLKADWQTVHSGVDSMDVERHWGKVIIGSAAKYPYVKRG